MRTSIRILGVIAIPLLFASACTPVDILAQVSRIQYKTQDPYTLPPLPVDEKAPISTHAYYDTVDSSSFADQIFLYEKDGGRHHKIPSGDYLLSEVLSVVPEGKDVEGVRLTEWEGKCDKGPSGFFSSSHAICAASIAVEIGVSGKVRKFSAAVSDVDAGRFRVPTYDRELGKSNLHSPVKQVIDALVEKLASRVAQGL